MLRPGHVIVLCVLALLTLGVVMVTSADMTVGAKYEVTPQSVLLSRQTVYMALAVAAMFAAALLPIRRISRLLVGTAAEGASDDLSDLPGPQRKPSFLVGQFGLWMATGTMLALLLLVYVSGIGDAKNGSHRWLETAIPGLGIVSMQPSEVVKWGVVVLLGWYGARHAGSIRSFWGMMPPLAAIGALCAVILLEDLGTALLIGSVTGIVLLAAGARWWHLGMLAPVAAAALVFAIAGSEYRQRRLTAFLDPYADPQGNGFHIIQSLSAIVNGEVSGRGLGFGLQKLGYLPEARTDFLFAVICEELGIAGAALAIALLGGLLLACHRVVRSESDRALQLIGLGVTTTIGLQAVINLAVVTKLAPTKGIALPLLSAGGTGWILTAASLGLLVAMDRSRVEDESTAEESSFGRGGGRDALLMSGQHADMPDVPTAAGTA